jgi:hypothetical protein
MMMLLSATVTSGAQCLVWLQFSAVHKDKTLMERAAERVPASAFIDGFSLPGRARHVPAAANDDNEKFRAVNMADMSNCKAHALLVALYRIHDVLH